MIYAPGIVKGLTLTGIRYLFHGESNSARYGNELDLLAEYKVSQLPGLIIGAKFARFIGDGVNNMTGVSIAEVTTEDLTKTMAYIQYTF